MRETKSHLSRLYYLVLWKGYLGKKNTLELLSAIQYPKKMISLFYKDHFDKPIAISTPIDTVLLIAQLTIKPTESVRFKQKRNCQAKNKVNK